MENPIKMDDLPPCITYVVLDMLPSSHLQNDDQTHRGGRLTHHWSTQTSQNSNGMDIIHPAICTMDKRYVYIYI